MKLVRSIDSKNIPEGGCALTIGNYDGLHLGHQMILRRLVEKGEELSLPTVVMTFLPTPDEYFQKQRAAPRLFGLSARYLSIREHGVDVMLALPFNSRLANSSPEEFIRQILIEGLDIRYILTGDDFNFGKGRRGNHGVLKQFGQEHGFIAEQFQTISDSSARISSTRIRKALASGNMNVARQMLGRNYSMVGRVIHGDKRGRQWGFPTLNIAVRKPPFTGVFAVCVQGVDQDEYYGVANLGTRPTVGGLKTLLEVHLFNFDRNLYGRRICVEFIDKIRDERKFDCFDQLKKQILADCEAGKRFFARELEVG